MACFYEFLSFPWWNCNWNLLFTYLFCRGLNMEAYKKDSLILAFLSLVLLNASYFFSGFELVGKGVPAMRDMWFFGMTFATGIGGAITAVGSVVTYFEKKED